MDVSTAIPLFTKETLGYLAEAIKQQPVYTTFMQAHQALQSDKEAQDLLKEGRQLNSQLQFDWSKERQEQFSAVLNRFNQLPCVQAYHQAEQDLRKLFCAVDAIISEAAGIEFAVNARRRSCCGG